MYEASFKFHSRPFVAAPQPKCYFPAAVIEAARRTLERSIERGEGPGLVIGPPGTGKTLLCHLLAEQFKGPFAVALLASGRLKTCQALLQAIHYELELPYRGMDEGELRLSLVDFLEPKADGPRGLLLLVDEAHTLPWRLLDEIRLITNLVRDGEPRVRVVLAGGPSLEERFASPKLGSFAQRVAARCYLEPLDSAETADYVRAQIAGAGGDPAQLVDDAALRSIYRASDGIPRLINQVCDHALVLAALGQRRQVTSEAIDEAWADLQQLPMAWSGSQDRPSGQVVEFGTLDEADELPEAIPFRTGQQRPARTLHVAAPDEQLDAIEEQLSTIDKAEARTTTSHTEIDLDFPEFGDPFSEPFVEEELLVDPYRSDFDIFADAPRVSSWEGQQIGSLLERFDAAQPWTKAPERSRPTIAPPPAEETPAAEAFSPPAAPMTETSAPESSDVVDTPTPPASVEKKAPATGRKQPPAAQQPAALVAPTQLSGSESDRDVIVLEPEPPMVPFVPARPRGGEFRQLFSKLRRG